MKSKIGIIAGAILLAIVLAAGSYAFSSSSSTNGGKDTDKTSTQPTPDESAANKEIEAIPQTPSDLMTIPEVATHNTAEDCWTIIDKSVYDLTDYIPQHPGGQEAALACGIDGTSLFNERMDSTGESVGSGTPHSNNANNILKEFRIGTLE